MTAIGGSIESVSLDGRNFPATADADTQRKLGGFENDSQANGDGSGRIIKTRVLPALMGVVVECDDDRGDHEFLQALSDQKDYWAFAVTLASGVVYQGRMQINGELQYSNQGASCAFDLMGTGKLTKQ